MKFNPPPNWPASPEGFTPAPDWVPDPSLPAPPPGWQLWVEDDVVLPGEATDAARHHRQAILSFWVGVGVLLATAIATRFASSIGVLWWGGLLVGASSLIRSVITYRASRKDGAPSLSGAAKGLAVAGLVVALGAGAYSASEMVANETLNTAVGSCWHVTSEDEAVAVSCGDEHEYKAVAEVGSDAECTEDQAVVEADDADKVLCLVED